MTLVGPWRKLDWLLILYSGLTWKNGIGMTIMTNQDHELVYNYEMPVLVFGPKKRRTQPPLTNSNLAIITLPAPFASGPMFISRTCFYTQFVKKPRTIRF